MRRSMRLAFALLLCLICLPGIALGAAKPPVEVPAGSRVNDVVAVGQDVTIAGQVDGTVTVLMGNLHLTGTAVVHHDVAVVGGTLIRDPGAAIRGDILTLSGTEDLLFGLGGGLAAYALFAGLKLLWVTLTVAASLLWTLWPRRESRGTAPSLWRLLALGFLWTAVVLLVAGALCYTLWGIPLAAGLCTVAVVLSCLGSGMIALRIGEWAMAVLGQQRPQWQAGGLGALLLILPTGIPILGLVLLLGVIVAGLGQFVTAVSRRQLKPA